MPVSLKCSGCDKTLRVAEAKRGRQVKCPACGEVLRVPEEEDEDDFIEEVDAPATRQRAKKRGKKKSSEGGGLGVPIGIAVAVVLAVIVGFALRRSPSVAVLTDSTSLTSPNVAVTTQPMNAHSVVATSPAATANSTGSPEGSMPGTPSTAPTKSKEEDDPNATAAAIKATDDFFSQGMIPELRIDISEPEFEKLKAGPRGFEIGAPRPYVQGTIRENGTTTYENVAIKLKGSAGSFRPADDRPALSINLGKGGKQDKFHGLSKFHLNNSVQDDTYLHEWLCEELFRAAKIPATRVTHARVWLNNRDLGLYVLKSPFDKAFLQRHFDNAKGNLYEGGFVQDIDAALEKDAGKGVDDRSDLTALLAACREPDATTRWDRVEELLNIDQFVSFMAMEMMVGHWDGYTLNHNNYRLYFDPIQNQAHFLPHGMDQVFTNAGASIIDFPSSIVGSTVMLNGEWRTLYRKRVGELLALFSPTEELLKRIDEVNNRLRPVLEKISAQAAREHDDRVNGLKGRLVARVENLLLQQNQLDPKPREFDDSGRLMLTDWYAVSESPDAKLELVDLPKGVKAYSILCGAGKCNASWRCKTLLAKGTYVLHTNLRSKQIVAADEKNEVVGAGIYTAGTTRTNVRKGTVNSTPVEFKFTVLEDVRMVEFIAELRSRKGQVWFEVDSLYLTKKASE